MKKIIGAVAVTALAVTGFAQTNEGQPTTVAQQAQDVQTESQTLRQRVENQWHRLTNNIDENTAALSEEIQAKYGFKAECDKGFIGVFDALKKDNCYLGLRSLDNALASVHPGIDRSQLASITIELTQMGEWQSVTLADRQMKIPYNAHPARMQDFVNAQLSLIFNTTLEELQAENQKLTSDIKEELLYNVIAGPNLSPSEYQSGLHKLRLAAQKSYGSVAPSPAEFAKFGFDTVVLDKSYRSLHEEDGELRLRIDINEKPGKMFLQLIGQVHPVQSKWQRFAHLILPAQYSWDQVQEFRVNRDEARAASRWLTDNYVTRPVECVLQTDSTHRVSMKECRRGLVKLRASLEKYGVPAEEVRGHKLLIGDAWVRNNYYMKDQDALFLSADLSKTEMYNAISAKQKVSRR